MKSYRASTTLEAVDPFVLIGARCTGGYGSWGDAAASGVHSASTVAHGRTRLRVGDLLRVATEIAPPVAGGRDDPCGLDGGYDERRKRDALVAIRDEERRCAGVSA